MPRKHILQPGETLAGLAFEQGLLPETVWNHPENAALREARKQAQSIAVGDTVFIPDRTEKAVSVSTGRHHVFRYKAARVPYRLTLQNPDGSPRAGAEYTLLVDGEHFEGRLDATGTLTHAIRPDASLGKLSVYGRSSVPEVYWLRIGHLAAVTTERGVRARLGNLGYPADTGTQSLNEALRRFQAAHGLPTTGEADSATQAKLLECVGM